jgi:hypothetical protein
VDLILDAGELPGTPSTVVDLTAYHEDGRFEIVRVGAVPTEAIRDALLAVTDGNSSRLVRVGTGDEEPSSDEAPQATGRPLQELVDTTCRYLRSDGYETRKAALAIARNDFDVFDRDDQLQRHIERLHAARGDGRARNGDLLAVRWKINFEDDMEAPRLITAD